MSKLDELFAWQGELAPRDGSVMGEFVDGSAACTTTVGHIRAALAEVLKLRAQLETSEARIAELAKERDELRAVLDEPTEAMLDAPRALLLVLDGSRTYGEARRHCRQCGDSLDNWPQWAREEPDRGHINKASMAALIWHLMARAALARKDGQGGRSRRHRTSDPLQAQGGRL